MSVEVINSSLAQATSDSLCYERRVLIDVSEFIGDRPTIKGIQLTTTYIILYAESTDASGERRTDASDEMITRIMMKNK